ncbi:UbiA prenyltransferase family protein [Methanothermobacter sp.]|uniref:UbiA prenyltransferase family protein n=1 Tax=Methanothermobacter sp. TaxID=1884223 RepID=UPI0026212823|nr:UbiA prenyltransferase family protein [Methanothermobacter sp.]MDI9614586.1 UbiA prenyltransferase family protein [Methanothermobacter sp.]
MSNKRRIIRELITLPRPQLFPIPASAGMCGLALSSSSINFHEISNAIIIPILIWCGGQVLNDLFDSEFDKIYHPEWPIPSGLINKNLAFVYAMIFYMAGFLVAFYINIYCLITTAVAAFFATVYNQLKRRGIYGNICFGLAVASCVLIGTAINKAISMLILLVIFISSLVHMSDNILGTFPDIEADKKIGFQTLPIQIGPEYSAIISFVLFSLASLLTLLLWRVGLSIFYLPLATVAIVSILWTSFLVLKDPMKFCRLEGFWIVYSLFMGEILLYTSLIVGSCI